MMLKKFVAALEGIAQYIEKKKPVTLTEAKHMLALISVIVDEILSEATIEGELIRAEP